MWQSIADSPFDVVTVLEDDVDYSYANARSILNTMAVALKEIEHVPWDFLSWGYGPQAINKNTKILNLKHWRKPGICQGFFAYTITKSMAKLLLTQCFPYRHMAVDMWFYWDFIKNNSVNVLCLEPRSCYVIPGPSETSKMERTKLN